MKKSRGWTINFSHFSDPRSSAFIRGKIFRQLLFAAVVSILVGCGKSQPAPDASSSSSKAATISINPATAGSITGVISFKGAPPKLKPLDMTQDPACPSSPQPAETVAVNGGKLANVFVYIKEGLPSGTFAVAADPVVLDQKSCRYIPHVLGIMAGQPLKILNTDAADHNIHSMPHNNTEFNESQSANSKPVVKTFTNPEMMVPVQCNQHPWMRSYINVMPHPYFAVSDSEGKFTIKNLPPGEYTLAAVHEKLGEQTMRVKVGAKMDSDARFTFSAQ